MNITDYIDDYLEDLRSSSIETIPQSFVFAYGPYMCMNSGYERECDEIAKTNKCMAFMVHAAFLIRKITSGVTYGDAKRIIKNFNISIDNTFNGSPNLRDALIDFSNAYLTKIRQEQKEKGEFESFMTCASPIVPYDEKIEKAEEDTSITIADSIDDNSDLASILEKLEKLLLENAVEILLNYQLCNVLVDNNIEDTPNFVKLDKSIIRNCAVTVHTKEYYFLALVYHYKLYRSSQYSQYIKFFKEAGDFSKTQSYSAFEAMVDNMANSTRLDIAAESWDDPSLDEKEEKAIYNIINSQNSLIDDSNKSKYDFGLLNDFINIKRFMKFEEFPNRLFLGSLEKARVINVNNMGGNRNYYEMDNDTVACPFLDLRTYQPGVIVLYADTHEIQIYYNLNEIY